MCELVGILVEMAGPTLFNKAHDRSEIRPSEIFLHFEIRTMNYDAVIMNLKVPRATCMLVTEVAKARVVSPSQF